MSLAIDVDTIAAVLLDDGWHDVHDWTFSIDAYEFVWYGSPESRRPDQINGGAELGASTAGFEFTEYDDGTEELVRIAGPICSIRAVRHDIGRSERLWAERKAARAEAKANGY